jgi:hypothetical protein
MGEEILPVKNSKALNRLLKKLMNQRLKKNIYKNNKPGVISVS